MDTPMTNWLTCLDVSAVSGLFAVGRSDGTVIVAELASAEPRWIVRHHTDRVSGVCFVDDVVWTTAFDGALMALDPASGDVARRIDTGHGCVRSLRPAGADQLITGGDDGHARLWRRDDGGAVQTLDEKRHGPAYSACVAKDWIAIGYRNGWVALWEPANADGAPAAWAYAGQMQPAGRRDTPVYAIAASPTGDCVAFARDSRVTLCTPGEWRRIAELDTDLACNDLHFASSGKALAGACSERHVRIWDNQPMAGNAPGHWNRFGRSVGAGMERGKWSQELVYSGVRFAGDDQAIATSFDGTVQLFAPSRPGLSPQRVAEFGGSAPSGWSQA
jgi:WD40 repeat protein